ELHRTVPILLSRHIQVHIGRLAALGANLRLDLFAFRIQDIAKHHPGAFLGEQPGFRSALSSGPTANQGHFACESCHVSPPPMLPAWSIQVCSRLAQAVISLATCRIALGRCSLKSAAAWLLAWSVIPRTSIYGTPLK